MTIAAIDTSLTDDRYREDIAEDVAIAINEHCDGDAHASVWCKGSAVRVYINGGSTKGYGFVRIQDNGSMLAVLHRTSCTNIVETLRALGSSIN